MIYSFQVHTFAGQRPFHVLIVDDEPLIASSIRRHIAREFSVTVVSNAREAIAVFEATSVDAVVSDNDLGDDTGGRALLALVAGRWGTTLRILMSAAASPPREPAWHYFLAKPFEMPLLMDLLRQHRREARHDR